MTSTPVFCFLSGDVEAPDKSQVTTETSNCTCRDDVLQLDFRHGIGHYECPYFTIMESKRPIVAHELLEGSKAILFKGNALARLEQKTHL